MFPTKANLRKLIREEIEVYFDEINQESSVEPLDLKNPQTGADLIFPNYIKERFDNEQVKSLKDIL